VKSACPGVELPPLPPTTLMKHLDEAFIRERSQLLQDHMADMSFVADATVQRMLAQFGGLELEGGPVATDADSDSGISRRKSGVVAKTWGAAADMATQSAAVLTMTGPAQLTTGVAAALTSSASQLVTSWGGATQAETHTQDELGQQHKVDAHANEATVPPVATTEPMLSKVGQDPEIEPSPGAETGPKTHTQPQPQPEVEPQSKSPAAVDKTRAGTPSPNALTGSDSDDEGYSSAVGETD
jgi:hypothetical protein